MVAKLLLNSLIGRFGMDYLKSVTKLLDKSKHNVLVQQEYLGVCVWKNSVSIDDNLYLDSYRPQIDKQVCESFNLDFVKVFPNSGRVRAPNFDERSNKNGRNV